MPPNEELRELAAPRHDDGALPLACAARASCRPTCSRAATRPTTPCAVVYRASWPDEIVAPLPAARARRRDPRRADHHAGARDRRPGARRRRRGRALARLRPRLRAPLPPARAPRPLPRRRGRERPPSCASPTCRASARRVRHRQAAPRAGRPARARPPRPRRRACCCATATRRARSRSRCRAARAPAAFAVERCDRDGDDARSPSSSRTPATTPTSPTARTSPRACGWPGEPASSCAAATASASVTKPGLGLEVGGPAINAGPRGQIRAAVERGRSTSTASGVEVEISVPGGEKMARRTSNPRLGIVGGISILGTTGIVRPFSTAAWRASVGQAIDVMDAQGTRTFVLDHRRAHASAAARRLLPELPEVCFVEVGDFTGYALKRARSAGLRALRVRRHGRQALQARRRRADDPLDALEGRPGVPRRAHRRTAGGDAALVAAVARGQHRAPRLRAVGGGRPGRRRGTCCARGWRRTSPRTPRRRAARRRGDGRLRGRRGRRREPGRARAPRRGGLA